jgi:hypothetical protein
MVIYKNIFNKDNVVNKTNIGFLFLLYKKVYLSIKQITSKTEL